MTPKKYGALSSSQDPQQISLTVTSIINVLIGALVAFGVIHTVDAQTITSNLQVIVQDVVTIIPIAYAAYHSCMALYGLVRKLIHPVA